MVRLYLPIFLALLILVIPKESVASDMLAELREVAINVAIGKNAKKFGVAEEGVKKHTLGLLRRKLPYLVIKDSVLPKVSINITLGSTNAGVEEIGYFGQIEVEVFRTVTIQKTGMVILANVWETGMSFVGPGDRATTHVRKIIDELLTRFVADWHRGNPQTGTGVPL